MSEDALAEHFAKIGGASWRYVSRWGRWFKWGGDVWREDETDEVFSEARHLCRTATYWPEASSLTLDQKRKMSRKATAGAVRDMAGSDRRMAATTEQWDTDPWLLGVPGGVVDLRTGQLSDGQHSQYITKKCAVLPQPGPHPLFDMVLERASDADKSMREYLIRWFGYMLTGDVREECFLFLHGPGGSGKGTLVKCLADIMGDYAKTVSMEALVEAKVQRHPQELAKLARAGSCTRARPRRAGAGTNRSSNG
jgi:putative DNA primase/helicase